MCIMQGSYSEKEVKIFLDKLYQTYDLFFYILYYYFSFICNNYNKLFLVFSNSIQKTVHCMKNLNKLATGQQNLIILA